MTDLVIRSLAAGEEHLFESLPDAGLVGFAAFGDTYRDMATGASTAPSGAGSRFVTASWWPAPPGGEVRRTRDRGRPLEGRREPF